MSNCQRCKSKRIASVYAKSSGLSSFEIDGHEHNGYLPDGIGLGDDGDAVSFNYCMNCGQMQGEFPLPLTAPEQGKRFFAEEREGDDVYSDYFVDMKNKEYKKILAKEAKEREGFEWIDAAVLTSDETTKTATFTTLQNGSPNTADGFLVKLSDKQIPNDFPYNLEHPFKCRIFINLPTADSVDKLVVKNVVYKGKITVAA